jgi:uncharacterized protein (UPF0305 family)
VSNNFHIERFAKYYKQKKKYTYLVARFTFRLSLVTIIYQIKKKNWDGAESKTRPSNLPDIHLNQSELTRDTYLVRVNPHKSSSNSRK